MGNLWHACVPVHVPAGAGKNAKPRGLFAHGSQVDFQLYRSCTTCFLTLIHLCTGQIIVIAMFPMMIYFLTANNFNLS